MKEKNYCIFPITIFFNFQIDPSGPLATLRKLLLSEESIASLKKFLAHYWYTVIFIILGVLILMVKYDFYRKI